MSEGITFTLSETELRDAVEGALRKQLNGYSTASSHLHESISLAVARALRGAADDGLVQRLVTEAVERHARRVVEEKVLEALERRAKKAIREAVAQEGLFEEKP